MDKCNKLVDKKTIERVAQDIKEQVKDELNCEIEFYEYSKFSKGYGLELKGYFVGKIPGKLPAKYEDKGCRIVFNAEVTDPKSGNTFFYPIELYKEKEELRSIEKTANTQNSKIRRQM